MKITFKKGLKLNLSGALPADATVARVEASLCAVVPDDFPGFLPKVCVKEGDIVKAGEPVLFDKRHPEVKLVSPVAGRVREVVRGDRRKIMRVEIERQGDDVMHYDTTDTKTLLAESGLLAMMRQRPYDVVPSPSDNVRDIFVTAVDLAPLSVGFGKFASIFGREDYEAGVKALAKCTNGKVYFCHGADWSHGALAGAEMVEVEGPHPAGNVSFQIAKLAPVNKGEIVWTLDLATLGRIGCLVRTGKPEWRTILPVVGPEVETPGLVESVCGAEIAPLIAGRIKKDHRNRRIISGNVLTGVAVPTDGFLRYPYRQITVIAEGDDVDEFMGWASLAPSKISESRSFPGRFFTKLFKPDARLNGGQRAMIMSGEYDRYMPMDILPEYLLKAIMAKNIEDMEKLGIYEVASEDFAAAEYACTSKMPLQQIVRDGLDYLRKELE